MDVYYIGGSPCSGKSTVAHSLTERFGLGCFKADDFLEEFTARGAAAGLPVCRQILRMSADENWMRPSQVQCREEFEYYREVFPFVMEKLAALSAPCILAEGAAFLPDLMQAHGIGADRYIAIVPSRDFQFSRYRQRPWVPQVLQDCTDPDAAFVNWMERDALFALEIRRRCEAAGYLCLLTDGSTTPEERLTQVAAHFHLNI